MNKNIKIRMELLIKIANNAISIYAEDKSMVPLQESTKEEIKKIFTFYESLIGHEPYFYRLNDASKRKLKENLDRVKDLYNRFRSISKLKKSDMLNLTNQLKNELSTLLYWERTWESYQEEIRQHDEVAKSLSAPGGPWRN